MCSCLLSCILILFAALVNYRCKLSHPYRNIHSPGKSCFRQSIDDGIQVEFNAISAKTSPCNDFRYRGLFVQLRGLEPLPTYMDMNLNHARMPIPPQLPMKKRETGIEPATPTLARWCSTAEPLAHAPFRAQE